LIGIIEDVVYPDPLAFSSDDTLEQPDSNVHLLGAASNTQPSIDTPSISYFHSPTSHAPSNNWELEQSSEISVCEKFAHDTCGCRLANNKPCSTLFGSEYYIQMRAQASLLTREQLDMALLGSVMSTLMDGDVASGRHKPAKRQRTTIHFMHRGYHLCRATFTFLYGISKHRLKGIKDSCLKDGLVPRTHGNTKKTPHNALSYDMIINIMKFIQNFAEQNAILLPGRIPTFKRDDIKVLPSSDSKKVFNRITI